MSSSADLSCLASPTVKNDLPAIAIDPGDTLLVVWRNGQQALPFSRWPAAETPPERPAGCIPTGEPSPAIIDGAPRLTSTGPGSFSLTFALTGSGERGE